MSDHRELRLAALRQSFRERLAADRAALRRLSREPSRRGELLARVHRLGGSAGTFGAPRISEAADRVEGLLRHAGGRGLGEALAALAAELDRELDRELDQR